MKSKIVYIGTLLFIALFSCKKDALKESTDFPFLITQKVLDNDSTGVTLSAKVLDNGFENIIDFGFILKNDSHEYKISILNQSDLNTFQLRVNTNIEKQKEYIYRAYIQTTKHTILANKVSFIGQGSNSPQILDFSPLEGFDSTIVSIRGKNFGYAQNELKALINGIESKIEYFSNDSLKIRVPQMAYFGTTTISIKLGSKTITSNKHYKIVGPVIDSLSKKSSFSGERLTISGKYLTKNGYNIKVSFGGYTSEVIQKSENKITVIVPILNNDLLNDKEIAIRMENGLKSIYSENFIVKKCWQRKQDPPFAASWGENFFNYNSNGYFLFINEKKLFEYDEYSDNWTNISTYPGANNDNSIFTCLGNKFFKIGGYDYLGKIHEFWEFDFLAKVWKQRNKIPFGFYRATSFILNNTLFIVTDSKEIWMYNENTDSFTKKNNFPESLDFFISFIAQNKVYIVNSENTWEYDSQTDSWAIKSHNPFLKTYNNLSTIGFNFKGTGYVLYNGSLLYRYDLSLDKWILTSQYPERSSSSDKSAFVIGNRAFIGTINGYSDPYPRLYSFEN